MQQTELVKCRHHACPCRMSFRGSKVVSRRHWGFPVWPGARDWPVMVLFTEVGCSEVSIAPREAVPSRHAEAVVEQEEALQKPPPTGDKGPFVRRVAAAMGDHHQGAVTNMPSISLCMLGDDEVFESLQMFNLKTS